MHAWNSGLETYLFACQIALVAHQHFVDLLVSVAVDLIHPLLDVVEALLVGHIVYDDDAVRSTIVLQMSMIKLYAQFKTEHHHHLLVPLRACGGEFKDTASVGSIACFLKAKRAQTFQISLALPWWFVCGVMVETFAHVQILLGLVPRR